MSKKKVSLVLSGGGARGIAHIGAIEELIDQDFEICSIAGTSMGALVGGVYCLGKLNEYKEWMCSLDKFKVFSLVDFTLSREGFIKGDKVLNKMKDFIPDTNIEDLDIPYAAVAADILNMKEVVFTKGSIFRAIRASIAIPSVLTPVHTENAILVDGGVLNNIPISKIQRQEDDILVVVNVNANIPAEKPLGTQKEVEKNKSTYQKKIKEFYQQLNKSHPESHAEKFGYFDLINKTIGLMTYHIAQMTLQNHSYDILINVSRDSCGTYDFYKAKEMVEIGRNATKNSLISYTQETSK